MEAEPSYTVYIRLPFPRGDFVDPPPVKWDSSKDESLWKILSGVAKTDLDWVELAARFEVTVDFLLQQVTYLTERHASQVRAQMRKATAAARSSAAPSPVPGSDSNSALEAMRRTGSSQGAHGHTRAPSSLSIRKDSPMPRNDGGGAPETPRIGTSAAGPAGFGPPGRPQASRNSSSGTTAQVGSTGSTAGSLRHRPGAVPTSPRSQNRQRLPSLPTVPSSATNPAGMASPAQQAVDPPSPGPADSPSPESSASSSPAQSRIIRRPPRFQQKQQDQGGVAPGSVDDDDDDEAEPAFLPFRAKTSTSIEAGGSGGGGGGGSDHYTDPSATLRGDPRDFASNAARRLQNVTGPDPSGQGKGKGKERERILQKSSNSDSSENSAAFTSKPSSSGRRHPSGPLSPRRTAELKRKVYSREGSDGTPSMGSSFSDLDDASVTQSALEEALASKMQGGNTIGSTISNVFRSRYLPK